MRERLLHYIWKYQKFWTSNLQTLGGEAVQIIDPGTYNSHSGPDFLNANIEIGGQLWAGNVEIHKKSSDWFAHGHQGDKNYHNVIMHVVWEADRMVFWASGGEIPTLILKGLVDERFLDNYRCLLVKSENKFINCEPYTAEFDLLVILPWLEHLYRERLELKTSEAALLLKATNGDWERLLFILLLANFGQQLNRSGFLSMARLLDFGMVKGLRGQTLQLESLLFGMSGLLNRAKVEDNYFHVLKNEFAYLCKKFQLTEPIYRTPEFMRVRPNNFPTLRLSQFAVLYSTYPNLFSSVISLRTKKDFYSLFAIDANVYWQDHYNFGKPSAQRKTKLSRAFIENLIINTVLPIKNLYAKNRGKNINTVLRELISGLTWEDNRIVRQYRSQGFPGSSCTPFASSYPVVQFLL